MRWLKAYIKASWSYCESQNNVGTDHLGNSHPPASARSYLCSTFTSRLVGDHQDVTVTHIIQVFEGEDLEDLQKTEDWDLGPGARPGVNHFKRVRHHLLAGLLQRQIQHDMLAGPLLSSAKKVYLRAFLKEVSWVIYILQMRNYMDFLRWDFFTWISSDEKDLRHDYFSQLEAKKGSGW